MRKSHLIHVCREYKTVVFKSRIELTEMKWDLSRIQLMLTHIPGGVYVIWRQWLQFFYRCTNHPWMKVTKLPIKITFAIIPSQQRTLVIFYVGSRMRCSFTKQMLISTQWPVNLCKDALTGSAKRRAARLSSGVVRLPVARGATRVNLPIKSHTDLPTCLRHCYMTVRDLWSPRLPEIYGYL